MWTLITGIWGQFATAIVGIATVFATLLGLRHSIRRSQRMEIAHEQQRRTIERLKIREKVRASVDSMSDDDILSKLRDMGYLREP